MLIKSDAFDNRVIGRVYFIENVSVYDCLDVAILSNTHQVDGS